MLNSQEYYKIQELVCDLEDALSDYVYKNSSDSEFISKLHVKLASEKYQEKRTEFKEYLKSIKEEIK